MPASSRAVINCAQARSTLSPVNLSTCRRRYGHPMGARSDPMLGGPSQAPPWMCMFSVFSLSIRLCSSPRPDMTARNHPTAITCGPPLHVALLRG
mmetsp:Transcript_9852/g.28600  ORF Transcript_9852/g.28600 Transcript_9852/m.28600 type:complete len:95 (+) Transcript_9852:1360-1644(+)